MEEFGFRGALCNSYTAGYSFNLDGSTLYFSPASIFVAQVAGIHISGREQLSWCLR